MMIPRAVGSIVVVASVWFIPVTTKVIENLIRSAIMSIGTAQNLTDVNIGIGKAIIAVSLLVMLFAFFRGPKKTK